MGKVTKTEFEEFLILYDRFLDQCNMVASIFAEAEEEFLYVAEWQVSLPYSTCTGERVPGYIYALDGGAPIEIPFEYMYKTEEELKAVVRDNPDLIKGMVHRK